MGSDEAQYLIKKLIEQNYTPERQLRAVSKRAFSYTGWTCLNAEKYLFDEQELYDIERKQQNAHQKGFIFNSTWPPIWIEISRDIYILEDTVAGILFFSPIRAYQEWKKSGYASLSLHSKPPIWRKQQQAFIGFNEAGKIVLELVKPGEWTFAASHICPYGQCRIMPNQKREGIITCFKCQKLLQEWLEWLSIALRLAQQQLPPNRYASLNLSLPASIHNFKNETIILLSRSSPISEQKISESVQKETQTLQKTWVISRYMNKQLEKINQDTITSKQQQQAVYTEVAIDRSHKYLWMQSAWTMTEAMRHNTTGTSLPLPENHIYIELEQPHLLYGQNIAAFSFLRQQEHYWLLSLVDPAGQTIWKALYENREWKLPQGYVCPQQKCRMEEHEGDTTYILCSTCQKYMYHYTSWITTALHMINGDFQEEIEIKNPEYVIETTSKRVYDREAKQLKDVQVRYRYRVIRYFDASISTDKQPRTKRGSWMDGRPVAQNANEMNPEAIIYVRIQPKEHDRTYRDERYVNMRGKTQHIEPPPRLQPMTIATFRQLPHVQRVTRVLASKFEV